MTTTPVLSEDMALRIGLATRLLPDGEPTHILRVLADSIGLPPTADKKLHMDVERPRRFKSLCSVKSKPHPTPRRF
jgi:hypothetical protein